MKKIFTLSVVFTLSLLAKDIYTVDELIIKAMQNSPDLAISAKEVKASKSRYSVAIADYLPKVDASFSAGKFAQTNIFSTENEMVDDTLLLGNLTLRQLVYDFGKTAGNSDTLKYDSQALSSNNQQLISNKKMDVKSAYYVVLNSIAQIEVNVENVKLNAIQLYRSKKYFEAGIRTKIDVSDAKVESIKSNLDLRKSEYDLKIAYAALDQVIGFKNLENNYDVYSKKLDLKNLYSSLKEYDLYLKDSIKFAYENRHEIKSFKQSIKSSQAKARLTDSEYYPEFYFNADYTRQEADKFANFLPQDRWTASLNLDWNLYQGGASSARNEEQRIQINITEYKLQQIKLSIKKDVTQAYLNVNKSKDSVQLSQSLLNVSKEKFNQAQQRYEHGLSDYIELQQARQGYIDSMSSLVIDYYNYHNSIAVLDNAIGK